MKKYIIAFALCLAAIGASAQMNRTKQLIIAATKGWELELRLGYNLGGTSPLPLPAEIRSIDSYNPALGFSLDANVTKWLDVNKKWGIQIGVKLENKNMRTKATVKNYNMEIIGDGGELVKGRWTGGVQTKVDNSFLTFPILGTYKVHPRTTLKAGVFLSYLLHGDFSGYVYDGYLREGDPTGLKVPYTDGKTASYDFSSDLRRFQWGVQIGADWTAFKHLKVFGDLSWGLNSAFPKDFETITFSMYPIYVNMGVGYLF